MRGYPLLFQLLIQLIQFLIFEIVVGAAVLEYFPPLLLLLALLDLIAYEEIARYLWGSREKPSPGSWARVLHPHS